MDNGDPPEVTKRLLDVFIDLSTIRNEALWDTYCQVFELDQYSPFAKKQENKDEWVGLTEEEIESLWSGVSGDSEEICILELGYAIEARLKEKNL
jgi:hypothetical protein